MKEFGFVRLRSALSAGDTSLRAEEEAFIKSIDPDGDFHFGKPMEGRPTVFFVQTGGTEIYFKGCYEQFPEPYCLLVQGKRNSLAASLEIKTFLASKKKRCLLIMGDPKKCHDELDRYYKFFHIEQKLHGMRLGVIGRPSDWLIASNYNARAIKKALGIEIISIPMKEFLETFDERIIADPEDFSRFLKKTSRRESLRKSLYIHGALKKLIDKYQLSGFTLRCFDLLKSKQETSCLAFAMLNDAGIIATCEGDVPTMLTMALVTALTGKPTFMANPSEFHIEENEAIFAHCTCPFSMLTSYSLTTHFESGMGFGIHGTFPKGKMTVAKISPDLRHLRALELDMLESLSRDDLCRSQIHVKFDESMKPLLDDPYGNHMAFVYGEYAEELQALYSYLTVSQ